jgi:hypothetical protein
MFIYAALAVVCGLGILFRFKFSQEQVFELLLLRIRPTFPSPQTITSCLESHM